MWWFKKKKREAPEEETSFWKEDFSDCATLDYLPDYSICKCTGSRNCRFAAMYAGITLCSSPKHKSYIIEGSERFDPHKHLL